MRRIRRRLKRSRRDLSPSINALMDLYVRWARKGDNEAAMVLADAFEEQGYTATATSINRAIEKGIRRRPQDIEIGKFEAGALLLKLARKEPSDYAEEARMLRGIEDAVWLDSYSSALEERGIVGTLRRSAPDAPLSAKTLARRYALALTAANGSTLHDLWRKASRAEGKEVDAKELGYNLAMQSVGHGISWFDNHAHFDVKLPRAEWYASKVKPNRWIVEGYP